MTEGMTGGGGSVRQVLSRGFAVLGGGDPGFLEAEILLSHVLGRSREWMLAHGEEAVPAPVVDEYEKMVERRFSTGIPIAYLVGHREFLGLDFSVTPGVLVPRPETETLVEAVQEWLERNGARFPSGVLVDAGCGSGIIAVSLARATGRRVIATDSSPVAIKTAEANASRHGVQGLVEVRAGNWLEPVEGEAGAGTICAIASNPPYIPSGVIAMLDRDVRDFEPHGALDGGLDGLDSIRVLVREAHRLVPAGGFLAMEIGDNQALRVKGLLRESGWKEIRLIRDLAGLDRVVTAEKGSK